MATSRVCLGIAVHSKRDLRNARRMTTWQSLLYCAAAEVTLERIKNLIAVTGTEPLTVDFKEGGNTPAIADCAAAMANAHGGLILVGVTDKERDIVGVPRETMAHVADVLATRLESPDWQPEMIEVPLGDEGPGRYVLVIRIDRDTAPRPVFVQKRGISWAPVRMPGSTRPATRDELYTLFTEPRPGRVADVQWDLNRPEIPPSKDGTSPDPDVDLVMLSGLRVPVGLSAWGRPISERVVAELGTELDQSAMPTVLLGLTRRASAHIDSFHPEGQANRSNVANLVWRHEPGEPVPFMMTARIDVPGHYGRSNVQVLEFTLTLVSRLTAWMKADRWRSLDVTEWASLLEAISATLTSRHVVGPVADLAGVDPITVRQPQILHIVTGPPMAELLPTELRHILGSGASHGAHMLTDPALDLSNPVERKEQVNRWLKQIGSDAGLVGMEQLVSDMRRRSGSR